MRIAPGGVRYGAAFAVPGLLVAWFLPLLGGLLLVLGLAAVLFHRDPERSTPTGGLVAPADGTVQVIRSEDDHLRVGTFMNVHDVHVDRSPLAGTVTDVEHVPGAHRPAFTKESDRNERVHVDLDAAIGDVRVTLIAGAFARRIHPYVEAGRTLDRGERIGHISFGSRVDVLLPPAIDRSDLVVERGDAVRAGESLLVDPAAIDRVAENADVR